MNIKIGSMAMPKYKGGTDRNHREILEEGKAIGAGVIDCRKWGIGFDAIFFYRGKTFIVEIKTPEALPKTGSRSRALTEHEAETQKFCHHYKVPYNIISTKKEIRDLLTEKAGFAWEPLPNLPFNK